MLKKYDFHKIFLKIEVLACDKKMNSKTHNAKYFRPQNF